MQKNINIGCDNYIFDDRLFIIIKKSNGINKIIFAHHLFSDAWKKLFDIAYYSPDTIFFVNDDYDEEMDKTEKLIKEDTSIPPGIYNINTNEPILLMNSLYFIHNDESFKMISLKKLSERSQITESFLSDLFELGFAGKNGKVSFEKTSPLFKPEFEKTCTLKEGWIFIKADKDDLHSIICN